MHLSQPLLRQVTTKKLDRIYLKKSHHESRWRRRARWTSPKEELIALKDQLLEIAVANSKIRIVWPQKTVWVRS